MCKSLSFLLFLAASAYTAVAATTPTNRITCTGSDNQPSSSVLAFVFDTSVQVSSAGGGGVGKASYSLTMQIPLGSSYDTIYKIATTGKHIPSCVLTKPNGSSLVTITLDDVLISDVKLLSGDFYLNGVAGPRVELSLVFGSVSEQTSQ